MRGQLYHGHYLIISLLDGHGEVANEYPLILPRTLSIVRALALLKRREGKKKMRASLLGLPKSIYYFISIGILIFISIMPTPPLMCSKDQLYKNATNLPLVAHYCFYDKQFFFCCC